MPKKEYLVKLTDEERAALIALTKKGTIAARKLARAQMFRLADEGKPDAEIVAALGVGLPTVERVTPLRIAFLQTFLERGPIGSFLTKRYNRIHEPARQAGSWRMANGARMPFPPLAQAACRVHSEYLLYPIVKKLLTGQLEKSSQTS